MKRRQNGGLRKVCGCPRRNWPKCEHSWYLNYKPRGRDVAKGVEVPKGGYRLSIDREVGEHVADMTTAKARAETIRIAIRDGSFRRKAEALPSAPAAKPDAVTLAAFGETFLERAGKGATANNRACLNKLTAYALPGGGGTLGDQPIGAITDDQIEVYFDELRRQGRAASTRNKYVQLVKAMFRWGVKKGYLARNPVADSESIKREKHAKRSRRLEPDILDAKGKVTREGEEKRLLKLAGAHLQRLIIAALDTGMRRGELLSLQWRDVDLQRRELTVRAETTKTDKTRHLPISDRLAGVLSMEHTRLEAFLSTTDAKRLTEQERAALIARCHVFGDETGAKIANFKRAWETCILKAHGRAPEWAGSNGLKPASRAALEAIDLHFHDLRHEAGSRLLEGGVPLHHVQAILGHENLSQTSTYLNATRIGLHESMRRFDAARCKPVANESVIEHAPLCNDDSPVGANSLVN